MINRCFFLCQRRRYGSELLVVVVVVAVINDVPAAIVYYYYYYYTDRLSDDESFSLFISFAVPILNRIIKIGFTMCAYFTYIYTHAIRIVIIYIILSWTAVYKNNVYGIINIIYPYCNCI